MEFKALCIDVSDRTLNNFALSSCGILLETRVLFQHCKSRRNREQFPERHGHFDTHFYLSKHVLGHCSGNETPKFS